MVANRHIIGGGTRGYLRMLNPKAPTEIKKHSAIMRLGYQDLKFRDSCVPVAARTLSAASCHSEVWKML